MVDLLPCLSSISSISICIFLCKAPLRKIMSAARLCRRLRRAKRIIFFQSPLARRRDGNKSKDAEDTYVVVSDIFFLLTISTIQQIMTITSIMYSNVSIETRAGNPNFIRQIVNPIEGKIKPR